MIRLAQPSATQRRPPRAQIRSGHGERAEMETAVALSVVAEYIIQKMALADSQHATRVGWLARGRGLTCTRPGSIPGTFLKKKKERKKQKKKKFCAHDF